MLSRIKVFLIALSLLSALPSGAQVHSSTQPATAQQAPRTEVPVSLSPETLINLLRTEPGLLLQLKHRVVRMAADEGRILHEEDLLDEAVFSLLRRSAEVRAVATEEAVTRGYFKIKPNRLESEVERKEKLRQTYEAQQVRNAAAGGKERDREEAHPGTRENLRKSRADELQHEGEDENDDLQRISPEELPELFNRRRNPQPDEQDSAGTMLRQAGMRGGSTVAEAAGAAVALADLETSDVVERESTRRRNTPRALDPTEQPSKNKGAANQSGERGQGKNPEPFTRRYSPYENIPAMYDLYSQVTSQGKLERFGAQIFSARNGVQDRLPVDVPVDGDYVLGPGDALNVDLWGGISRRLQRTVDSTGRISLPEVGLIPVAGKRLSEVQLEVQSVLRTQYRDVQADMSLSRLRTIRVYVVGDVVSAGAYDISSLSTPMNALHAAGGPTERGSMRTVYHYRGKKLVQKVDLYELILHGVRSDVQRMQSGDTVLVPPMGAEITLEGMVRRPAIYELGDEKNLLEALQLAGGVLPSGSLRRIQVERMEAHERRTMVNLDLPEKGSVDEATKALEQFAVRPGDKIKVAPIMPYSDRTIYLEGHVFNPGRYPYKEGMKVTDLIKSYTDLLPEPYARHAEIIRLSEPDFRPVVTSFNLAEAMAGRGEVPELKPFDTVRIFGRFDFEDEPAITVSGEVREPGERRTNGETRLRDAIYLAGGITPDALLDSVQVMRPGANAAPAVMSVNLGKALAGDPASNILLYPRDRVIVHKNLAKADPPTVIVQGEVVNPGRYPLGEGMTASQLVRLAGGLKRSAYTERADLSRYRVNGSDRVLGEHEEIMIGKALSGDSSADVTLSAGDTLSVRQLTGWSDIGASISVAGEVFYPGVYGIREGERLSSILRRAGGFRPTGYAFGAVFERDQVRELDQQSREALIRRIESAQPQVKGSDNAAAVTAAFMQQQQQILARLRGAPNSGRLVIRISNDIARWEGTSADLEVRAGDRIIIPKTPGFVVVNGQVNNPSAVTFVPGKRAGWYLERAGGLTEFGNRKAIFVVRADGSVVGGNQSGFWRSDVLGTVLQPGDSVVVPEKVISDSSFWRTLIQAAQFSSAIAIAARVATGI